MEVLAERRATGAERRLAAQGRQRGGLTNEEDDFGLALVHDHGCANRRRHRDGATELTGTVVVSTGARRVALGLDVNDGRAAGQGGIDHGYDNGDPDLNADGSRR